MSMVLEQWHSVMLFTALADDASAVYFNPAAVTFLEEDQIMAGFFIN